MGLKDTFNNYRTKQSNQEHRTHSTSTQAQPNYYNANGNQGGTLTIVKVLYWLCLAAALWFCYLNIYPYATAVKFILDGVTDNSLMRLLLSIPGIGAVLRFFSVSAHWIIGLVLWAAIQTVEVLPLVLKRDRRFMRTVLHESEAAHRFAIQPNDDPAAKVLKRWYNRFPMLTITTARNLSLFVYAIDFLICILVYPPCDGGLTNLFFLILTGQWTLLNWLNISLTFVTLFAVEAIIQLLLWLGQIAYYYKVSERHV